MPHIVETIVTTKNAKGEVHIAPLGLTMPEAVARAEAAGVGISDTVHPTILRALTHLDISDDDIERAIDVVPDALGAGARVNA